jgi:hypothetical protein
MATIRHSLSAISVGFSVFVTNAMRQLRSPSHTFGTRTRVPPSASRFIACTFLTTGTTGSGLRFLYGGGGLQCA